MPETSTGAGPRDVLIAFSSQQATEEPVMRALVVHLQQCSGKPAGGHVPYAEFASHPAMVLIKAEYEPITLNRPECKYAMAFTAPDRFQGFVARQPEDQRPLLKSATLDGVKI